jgi:hypothetical protein
LRRADRPERCPGRGILDSSRRRDLVAVAITTAPAIPSVPDTHIPLVPSKKTRENARLVKMTRERDITPVTPN